MDLTKPLLLLGGEKYTNLHLIPGLAAPTSAKFPKTRSSARLLIPGRPVDLALIQAGYSAVEGETVVTRLPPELGIGLAVDFHCRP